MNRIDAWPGFILVDQLNGAWFGSGPGQASVFAIVEHSIDVMVCSDNNTQMTTPAPSLFMHKHLISGIAETLP